MSADTATGIVNCPHVAVDIKTADYKLLISGESSLLLNLIFIQSLVTKEDCDGN